MKTLHNIVLTLFGACVLAPPLFAGTYIESRDAEDVRQRIYIDGVMVRIESDDTEEYVIVDMQKHRYLSVNDLDQQVVDMSGLLRKKEMPQKNSGVQFVKLGPGPVIGGYATERYKIVYKSVHCFDELLSQDALKIPDVKHYYDSAQQFDMQGDHLAAEGDPAEADDICAEAAELLNQTHYSAMGAPMAAFDDQGEMEHEVVQIVTDIAFPAETFQIPAGYDAVSIEALMRQNARDLLRDDTLIDPPPGKSRSQ